MATETFSNEFGSVYADRVSFNIKKGWFGGGSVEDLPMRHITSVRAEVTRSPVLGAILALIGLACVLQGGGGLVIGAVLLAVGIALLLGRPSVTINTAGNDLRRSNGSIFQREAGTEFAAALRGALFPG